MSWSTIYWIGIAAFWVFHVAQPYIPWPYCPRLVHWCHTMSIGGRREFYRDMALREAAYKLGYR